MENNTVVASQNNIQKAFKCGNEFAHNAENHNKESVVSESNKTRSHILQLWGEEREWKIHMCIYIVKTWSKIKRKEPIVEYMWMKCIVTHTHTHMGERYPRMDYEFHSDLIRRKIICKAHNLLNRLISSETINTHTCRCICAAIIQHKQHFKHTCDWKHPSEWRAHTYTPHKITHEHCEMPF